MTSLKYFCESAPEYHVAAGSLLEVAVNRAEFSFPVGKVDIQTMYPMDLEEFMLAMEERELVLQINKVLIQTDRCRPFITMLQCSCIDNISSWGECLNVSCSLPKHRTILLKK